MRSKDKGAPGKKAPAASRRAWTPPTVRRIAASAAELSAGNGPDAETAVS